MSFRSGFWTGSAISAWCVYLLFSVYGYSSGGALGFTIAITIATNISLWIDAYAYIKKQKENNLK